MFKNSNATVVIPSLKALDTSAVTDFPKFANLNSCKVEFPNFGALNFGVAKLPERLHECEFQHSFGLAATAEDDFESEKSPSTIESKFLTAQVNNANVSSKLSRQGARKLHNMPQTCT